MSAKVLIEKGSIGLDFYTEQVWTVSVAMADEHGMETDVSFKRVVTLGEKLTLPKWYAMDGTLQDEKTTLDLEMCYQNKLYGKEKR